MLNQTRQKFNRFKRILLRQEKEVEDELKHIEKEDPVMADALVESSEPGTDSWLADAHGKALALRDTLQQLLKRTQMSLIRLRNGNYGKCEKCGKNIEPRRLEIFPTATLCASCSRKTSKK